MDFRVWIVRGLWYQLVSLLLVALTGLLSLFLSLAGDVAGAAALRALALVAGVFFVIAHVGLVVLLAIRELDWDRVRPD
jgi:hypothetical protein